MSKKKSYHRKPSFKVPIAPTLGLLAGLFAAPSGWATPVDAVMRGDYNAAYKTLCRNYLFYDIPTGTIDLVNSGVGVKAALLGAGIHYLAGRSGVNRYIGKLGLPVNI